MIRPRIARLTRRVLWRVPGHEGRMLAAFARAERSSHYDLLAAARLSTDVGRRAAYLLHASDELRHAALFEARAEERGVAEVGLERADFEHLFERLGEQDFLAFVHRGEERGRRQFQVYRDELARRGDPRGRAMFDAILADEDRHAAYTRELLTVVAGGDAEARRALRRMAAWEAWRLWRRAGSQLGSALFAVTMTVLYAAMAPLAGWHRLRRPGRGAADAWGQDR